MPSPGPAAAAGTCPPQTRTCTCHHQTLENIIFLLLYFIIICLVVGIGSVLVLEFWQEPRLEEEVQSVLLQLLHVGKHPVLTILMLHPRSPVQSSPELKQTKGAISVLRHPVGVGVRTADVIQNISRATVNSHHVIVSLCYDQEWWLYLKNSVGLGWFTGCPETEVFELLYFLIIFAAIWKTIYVYLYWIWFSPGSL